MALTVDIPLIRLADGDHWPILMVRSGLTVAAALAVWLLWRSFSRNAPPLVPGKPGLAVAGLYGISAVAFMAAVYNTSTANLVFILAFNSMFAALLSWIFLKERPRPATLIAMAVMLVGVLIIVGDGIGTGNFFGDMMALASAFSIALAITITRASGRDMGFAALVAVALPFAIAAVMTTKTGYRIEAPWWIVLNGGLVIPLAFFCLANGPKYLPGPEVAMFYLLETVLAPVWVWLIFSEVPTTASLIGGTILIATLAAHSLWQLHTGRRRRRAAGTIRHPV
ncbi:DMT family transporter [Chelativorans salis]|uniref:DMT family transporter n=1 Tax=Chelativorans salis TaxID=2978478 RepID=A0ABT2LQH0_9HYPH|nr:DMT family transporter [Chelativorans sp. EGI FJ00035]MCT7375868.1 DMT family transporter [Chelativorans sp. EGI FJ00035]